MRCGHTMHAHCFDEYTVENFRCPLCQKALTNMSSYYDRIDEMLKHEVMPPEHRNKFSEILCHDCGKRSTTTFHFEHHKCQGQKCGSYNTRVLRTFRPHGGSRDAEASASSWQRDAVSATEREGPCAGGASGATASASGGTGSATATRMDCESRGCESEEMCNEDGRNSSGESLRMDDVRMDDVQGQDAHLTLGGAHDEANAHGFESYWANTWVEVIPLRGTQLLHFAVCCTGAGVGHGLANTRADGIERVVKGRSRSTGAGCARSHVV
ncbi:hypothetical protein FGB62_178g018 [Gracilaria domingensis]|nr:hypothetical protein FGB62_178g018 [Gracilaria domingensis]